MFSLRNKKDISIFRMKKAPYLLLWSSSSTIDQKGFNIDSFVSSSSTIDQTGFNPYSTNDKYISRCFSSSFFFQRK